jgi:succinoglycan biosynthesis transport protein ExoP
MLKRNSPALLTVADRREQGLPEANVDDSLSVALGLVRRQWRVIGSIVLAAILLALGYLLVTPPTYVSKSYLLLDTRKLQLFQQQSVLGEASFDLPAVESQLEILKSHAIAQSVVEDLKLTEDPEFTGNVTSFFGSLSSAILNAVNWTAPNLLGEVFAVRMDEDLTDRAVRHLRSQLQVQRVRLTYVIEIGFNSRDARKAARIANAVAEAYIVDQTQAKQFTTKRAAAWLNDRVTELREQAIAADRAVQDFRTKNGLINVGGRPMDEQQLAELTSQLSNALAEVAEMKARLDQVQEVIASDSINAVLTDAVKNDVITRLRQQYVEASRRESDYATRYGKDHLAVVTLRREMQQIRRAAVEELRRVAEGYKNDLAVAQGRQAAIQANLETVTQQNAGARQFLGPLAILESSAQALRTLHDTFLQRYSEATQQQSFNTTEARILTPAAGGTKTHPKWSLILPIAGILGLVFGGSAAFAREKLDLVFRTAKQVEQALGAECLGILPAVPRKNTRVRARGAAYVSGDVEDRKEIKQDLGVARQVVLTPFSRFTETVRGIKVAADTSSTARDVRVIGVISAVPGEGKTTIAANLAQLMSHSGGRTLLIDGDLRNPSLTKIMAPSAQTGLLHVISGECDLPSAVWRDPITCLDFLPAVLPEPLAYSSELLASQRMQQVVAGAREHYDYVVVDFAPLGPVVDAKAAAHFIDAFVLVIHWGRTSLQVVTETLSGAEMVQSKLLGAVLNLANPAALKRLESYKGSDYHRYYGSYVTGT